MTKIRRVDGFQPAPAVVAEAAEALRRGDLLVYPTETLYALGGVASAGVARRVRRAKGREEGKALPLVAADAAQARALCGAWPATAELLASRFWPGPLTLVLSAHAALSAEITAGLGTVAVRVPGLALPRELCRLAGPLISTSANRSGDPPHSQCRGALAAVGAHAALALDAGELAGLASTIVDLTGRPELLRAGALAAEAVAGALREVGASLQTERLNRGTQP